MMTLADVLNAAQLAHAREVLARVPFRDGAATAGPAARKVKNNEQARGDDPKVIALTALIREALEDHPVFMALARPARWSRLMVSRYGPGQQYGLHTDAATMRDEHGGPLRTDLSFTLFLAEADSYDGGALLIDGPDGEREFRPEAGSAVLYQTGQLHRVTPVTRGQRLACVGWIESRIRRSDRRELLFDLERVADGMPDGEARILIEKSIGNLLRMWSGA